MVDYNVRGSREERPGAVDIANVKMSMNPFVGSRWRSDAAQEKGWATEVVAVSCGCRRAETRTAMRGGPGILVQTDVEWPLAKLLKALVMARSSRGW